MTGVSKAMFEGKSILYLTPGCFDKGGISRYNRYQIRALRDLVGAERVHVFSVLGPGTDCFEDPFETSFYAGGISTRDKAHFVARVVAEAVRRRPDVVLSAHVNLSGLGTLLARATRATSVLNVYGSEVWSGFRRDAEWGLRRCDHVVSDCHFTGRYIEGEGLRPSGTTAVIWDCVDVERFSPGHPDALVLARYGIPDPTTGKNLVTFGRMSSDAGHKGYERLFEVFVRLAPQLPDLRLVYGGRGDLVDLLRSRARDHGLSDRVFFTGMVHERDLTDVYRSAHVFSLVSDRGPGRGEGIPLTPLEAGSCGIPILVGNQDGSQEAVMDDLPNGFVLDPFDLDAHADAVRRIVSSQELAAQLGRSAREVALREFSFEGFRAKHRDQIEQWLTS